MVLSSLSLMPSDGRMPRFLIGLRIVNPNRSPLRLRGLAYNVELEGQRVATGVASHLADVPPYAESEIELSAGINLVSSVQFFNRLIAEPGREKLNYLFRARLDVADMRTPMNLIEQGALTFTQTQVPGALGADENLGDGATVE